MKRVGVAVGLSAIGLSIVLLAVALGYGLRSVGDGIAARQGDVISVRGTAQRNVTSDRAVWRLSVTGSADTPAAALDIVDGGITTLEKFLTDATIGEDEITRGSVSVYANKEWVDGNQTGNVLSYEASRELILRSTNVDLVVSLTSELSQVLAAGVSISTAGPEYYFDALEELRPELLAEAMKDAEDRAAVLLGAVGSSLGEVRSVSTSPFQVTTQDATNVDTGGYYDTTTVQKTVVATVTAEFATK